jgi:predicted Zn-dependent protease
VSSGRLSSPERRLVRRCLESIDAGSRAAAVAAARELAAAANGAARCAGARLLFLLRLYQECLDALQDWIAEHPDDAYPRRLHYSLLRKLHFDEEAETALDELLRRADDPALRRAAVEHYRATHRPREALAQLEHLLERAPDDAVARRLQLALAVEAGEAEIARRAAGRLLTLGPEDWPELVEQMLRAGLFDEAERWASRRAESPRGAALLARLDLFRGAWQEAYDRAAAAFERDPASETAVAVMVGASIMTGDLERAEGALSRLSAEPGPTLRVWRADLRRRRGDLDGAKGELTRLQNEVTDYFAAKLLWVLVRGELEPEPWPTTTAYDGLLEGQLAALGIEVPIERGAASGADLRAAAAAALEKLAGNRTPFPSVVEDGRLRLLRVPPSPRHRIREIQHMATWMGLPRVAQEVDAELERIGDHPIARCYGAEIDLWSGDYDRARRKFADILDGAPRTTWAWIGLGASQVLLGDPRQGLSTLDEGVRVMGWRGATLPVYRGEALLRLGRFDEAADELAAACDAHPSRVAAWTLRLLAAAARGGAAERDELFARIERMAPALLADAARVAGVEAWWPGAAPAAVQVAVAEQALASMRGNRSSSCAFWLAPGTGSVRSVLYQRPPASPDWEAHEKRALSRLAKE